MYEGDVNPSWPKLWKNIHFDSFWGQAHIPRCWWCKSLAISRHGVRHISRWSRYGIFHINQWPRQFQPHSNFLGNVRIQIFAKHLKIQRFFLTFTFHTAADRGRSILRLWGGTGRKVLMAAAWRRLRLTAAAFQSRSLGGCTNSARPYCTNRYTIEKHYRL